MARWSLFAGALALLFLVGINCAEEVTELSDVAFASEEGIGDPSAMAAIEAKWHAAGLGQPTEGAMAAVESLMKEAKEAEVQNKLEGLRRKLAGIRTEEAAAHQRQPCRPLGALCRRVRP